MFTRNFYARRSQKHKMANDLSVIFALLGSTSIKALHKMLMKWTPVLIEIGCPRVAIVIISCQFVI